MKILVLSNYFPPHYIGGYELACFDTVKYLEQAGHDVLVLTGEYKQQSINFEKVYRKLKYIDYKSPSYLNKNSVEEFNYEVTKNVIEQFNPDIVYIWSLRLISLSPLWAVEKLKIKKIFEIGDFWMKGFLATDFLSKLKRTAKQILPFFKAVKVDINPIVSVSKWMVLPMKNQYGSKDVFQVPNGTKVIKHKIIKDKTIMKYMFCGRLDYSKGLDIAIKALSNLKDRNIEDFQFHIYGDGDKEYILKCKKMIELLGLNKEVFFHGKIENPEDMYKENHVLLMPTRMKEPFGLVIIEAMNYGVIPIATNDYGPAEIIDDKKDGLLFSYSNIDDLTLKILQLHNKWDLLDKFKLNAYEKVATKFDLNIVKKEIENILINIVGNKDE